MSLSDTWLKNNNGKLRDKVEVFTDRDSLSVRISPKGKIVFQLRYRFDGKQERIDIGTYPYMSLKQARFESERLRGLLDSGLNPKTEVQLEKQQHIQPTTVNDVFDLWYDAYCMPQKKQHKQIKRGFENHIFPILGNMPIDRVDIRTWLNLFEPLAIEYKGMAKILLGNTKQMLKWAVKRELIKNNPLSDVFPKEDLNIVMKPTKRYLTDEELVTFFECLQWSRLSARNKIFLELCLMFACRNGELRRAEKSHFDFENKVWIIPPENHKTGYKNDKTLIRPILPKMEELLLDAMGMSNSKYVFPAKDLNEYMTDSSSTALPDSVIGWVKRFKKKTMVHWSMHDLRRTARTNFSKFSTRSDIAEIMIGHSLPKMQETYDLHGYVSEQAAVYEQWLQRIEQLKQGKI